MKNKERIQILEYRVDAHTKLLAKIITELELDNKPQLKQLDHGVFSDVHERWKYAAVDMCGEAYIYTSEPESGSAYFMGSEYRLLGYDYDTLNWQDSLIKRETNELTGNKLCKAMLARGDRYVMCLVSDVSEESARHEGIARVVCSYGADYFEDTTEDVWNFATPINSHGEPLPAAEVGL